MTACRVEGCPKSLRSKGLCAMHYMRQARHGSTDAKRYSQARTPVARYLEDVILDDGCWHWGGSKNDQGYGTLTVDGKRAYAHRFSYELMVGPIPDGLQIDHLCRTRDCSRPDHLEPVTGAENMRRAKALVTHCPDGHAYTPENTYRRPSRPTKRQCRTCTADRKARRGRWACQAEQEIAERNER